MPLWAAMRVAVHRRGHALESVPHQPVADTSRAPGGACEGAAGLRGREDGLAVARSLGGNRQRVDRCVRKALEVGTLAVLEDVPRASGPSAISAGSRAWLAALACRKADGAGLRGGDVDGAAFGRAGV